MQIYQKLPKKCTESLVIALLGVLEKKSFLLFLSECVTFPPVHSESGVRNLAKEDRKRRGKTIL